MGEDQVALRNIPSYPTMYVDLQLWTLYLFPLPHAVWSPIQVCSEIQGAIPAFSVLLTSKQSLPYEKKNQ